MLRKLIDKIQKQHKKYPTDHDLCVCIDGFYIDIVNNPFKTEWTLFLDGDRQKVFKTRKMAIDYLTK